MLTKGASKLISIDFALAAGITTAVAGGCAILSIVFLFPIISKKLQSLKDE
jgi:hypothetical protein